MGEKRKKDINQYFVKKLYDELNILDASIYQEIRKVKDEANTRGLLKSGMTLNSIWDAIINNTIISCKEKLNLIDEFQDYVNFKISEKQIAEIEEIFLTHYVPFLKNKLEKTYVNQAKEVFGDSDLNIIEQHKIQTSIQNIKILIQNKMEDVKIKNRLQKDPPSVRLSKYSTLISFTALIVAIISLFVKMI
ncbi:hypothetical protein [Virgibacillus sp. 6R]|uniref:hypothetical protein n=1 Tax=Metabacillus sp. 22489 TaxID=3453928 RepID=UPI0011A4FCAD